MAKKKNFFTAKGEFETPVKVEVTFSGRDYKTLEEIIQEKGSVFKTVEDYLMFMAQNRIMKFRRG